MPSVAGYFQIFTRILNSFNLPMGPPEFQMKSSGKDPWNGDRSATLIVSLLVSQLTLFVRPKYIKLLLHLTACYAHAVHCRVGILYFLIVWICTAIDRDWE